LRKFKTRCRLLTAILVNVLILTGCAHYTVNDPLKTADLQASYDFAYFSEPKDVDRTFVVLTFSGGGTRAAALSYGVLEKMRAIGLPGTSKTLLDEVDVVSTISGGSFTGAYYALFGDRIFADFKSRFLNRDIEGELTAKLFNPVNWLRLASPYYSRIDLAAELYDETIFDSRKFEALAQKKKRPFLIIGATDLYNGARFEFTGDRFRYLGSNLNTYPIARAVAASSAFPFLLSPISLFNYPLPGASKKTDEDELAPDNYWLNKRRYYASENKTIYDNTKDFPYIHLMDGGLADNLGLRAIYDLYVRSGIRARINNGTISRFLVIVVNAKTDNPQTIQKDESPPGLGTVAYKTATISMDNYSFETVEAFRELLEERARTQRSINDCQKLLDAHAADGYKITPLAGGKMKLYMIDLAFDNLSSQEEKTYFKSLPTSFSLTEDQVNKLIEVGGRLLIDHPEFKKFMDEYRAD
jgi:NTE family protein